MVVVIHRINTIEQLKSIPSKYGTEIDIRTYKDRLVLNHEPKKDGDHLEEYLKEFKHELLILNIKTSGIERDVIALAEQYHIKDHFLLDVEYPFIYFATRRDKYRKIAVRYSEAEPIEFTQAHEDLVDWAWIDTNSKLPLDEEVVRKLQPFKTCLVCPERWGRPQDIPAYIQQMQKLKFKPTGVMTSLKHAPLWDAFYESSQ